MTASAGPNRFVTDRNRATAEVKTESSGTSDLFPWGWMFAERSGELRARRRVLAETAPVEHYARSLVQFPDRRHDRLIATEMPEGRLAANVGEDSIEPLVDVSLRCNTSSQSWSVCNAMHQLALVTTR